MSTLLTGAPPSSTPSSPQAPTGTVTFLFTDIEGSTKRWELYPRAMQAAIALHNSLLREAIEAHGGYVFKMMGDAFCSAFPTARQALDAAIGGQRAVLAADWGPVGQIKVRMALHTGVAELRDGDYYGQPLNRVARLLSTGHGGQILLSLATEQLVRDDLPEGTALRDLGEGGLRDLVKAEHVYQVLAPGLPTEFPPLKALDTQYIEPGKDGTRAHNPYKGLRAFQEADAPDFFGREALTGRLLERMREEGPLSRFLAVVGPSGSGKSSVVRAGLVPALRQGKLPGSERWVIVEMLPGPHPLEELEAVLLSVAVNPPESLLGQLKEDERGLLRAVKRILPRDESVELVLVIDQFEEVFTLVDSEPERVHFLESLCAAVTDPRSRVRVVLTLRADFFDRPLLYPDPGELMTQRTAIVLPLSAEELERAIVEPAKRVGVSLEPELLAAIIKDVGEQVGALPLLQYALTELFEQRRGKVMTLQAYQAGGGVLGALGRRADETYEGLSEGEKEATRQLFLRLVTLGEGTEDTRRRARRSEFETIGGDQGALARVIELYGKYRLLTFDMDPVTKGPTVEVAHEALIRTWGRLREWLDESRADLRVQRQLMAEAAEWARSDRDPSYLATGARLAQFEVLAEGAGKPGGVALTAEEKEYLQASIEESRKQEAAEKERQAKELAMQKRAASRLRVIVAGLAVFLVVAAILTVWALNQSQVAQDNATRADHSAATAVANQQEAGAQRLLAQYNAATAVASEKEAQANLQHSEALRLAAEANKLNLSGLAEPQVIGNLAVRSLNAQYTSQGDEALGIALALPYPRLVFTGHASIPGVTGRFAMFSPDGKYVASYSRPDITLIYWDAQTGKEIKRFQGDPNTMIRAAFSPDGKVVVSDNKDFTLTIWDPSTRKPLHILQGHSGGAAVFFSTDGKVILTASEDKTAKLWDAQTGASLQTFAGHTEVVWWADISWDNKRVLTVGLDGTAKVWDVATGKELQNFTIGQSNGGVISPDGKQVLLLTESTDVVLLDVASGAELKRLSVNSLTALANVAFSPDGKLGLIAGWDSTVRLWDLQTGKELRRINAHPGGATRPQFAPDGRSFLTMGVDQVVAIWDMQLPSEYPVISADPSSVAWVGFSHDGARVASGGAQNDKVQIWDARTGTLLASLIGKGATDIPGVPAFSPDDRTIATIAEDHSVRLWEVASGKELHTFTETLPLSTVHFSPDGQSLLLTGLDASQLNALLSVVDIATGKSLYRGEGPIDDVGGMNAVFSPDGKQIFSTGAERGLLRDAQTGREIFDVRSDTPSIPLYQLDYSRDGSLVMACSPDTYIWDAHTGSLVRKIISRSGWSAGCEFSPDSKSVLTIGTDNVTHLWDIASGQEIRRFAGYGAGVSVATFAPDGKRVALGLTDGKVRFEPVDYKESINWLCGKLWRDLTADERDLYEIKGTEPTCPKP